MCILFVAVEQHQDYPLLLAANRDEFFARPTRMSGFWPEHPQLLAGRDLEAGGSWMGLTTTGRLAALTNIRNPARVESEKHSRGHLVTGYLTGSQTPVEYQQTLSSSRNQYNGFNLLFGRLTDLWIYNNHLDQTVRLEKGVHGLSNADIHSVWPKTSLGVEKLADHCRQENPDTDSLFALLRDETRAPDHMLPNTGVSMEWEQRLSSIFIRGEEYGTRSSTLLLVDRRGRARWLERTFDNRGEMQAEIVMNLILSA
ncbi:NRDE family protein [Bowmanella dokdonensis]|uniref:NRDE family protein n=1 Tax=Bowmanella dokdonensis TaxID=751969 RepID=A0A939DM77_9ALTE|nr:NRDE family protein [Bowmanella dokdonensis]MBN7825170.1 NRDE family protein [Bowmanella dokdonensis]